MNYVQYYDNVLTKKLCEELIDKFENSSSEYETHSNNTMSFTQINLNQNKLGINTYNHLQQFLVLVLHNIKMSLILLTECFQVNMGLKNFV